MMLNINKVTSIYVKILFDVCSWEINYNIQIYY